MNILIDYSDYFSSENPSREEVTRVIKDTYAMLGKPDVDEKDVYYSIAGLMFLEVVSRDAELEDLCLLAGELELPDHHISNKDAQVKIFRELIGGL